MKNYGGRRKEKDIPIVIYGSLNVTEGRVRKVTIDINSIHIN